MSEEKKATRWSADGMVCFEGDGAYGLRGAQTVYLGKAEDLMEDHPLPKQIKKPLELKFGRKSQFPRSETFKKGGVRCNR